MKHSVTWVSATCLEAVSPFLPKPQNAASSVCTEHPCKHPGVPLAWGEGGQGTSAGGQMPKQPEAMHTQKGVPVSKKTLFSKTGMAGWTQPEGVC